MFKFLAPNKGSSRLTELGKTEGGEPTKLDAVHTRSSYVRVRGVANLVLRGSYKDWGSARHQSYVGTGGGGLLWRSFLCVVFMPSFFVFLYYSLWASDVYVVEAKMVVREAPGTETKDMSGGPASLLRKIGVSGAIGSARDSMIIYDYIKSRSLIEDIGGKSVLAEVYSSPSIDWFSRLDIEKDIERIREYFRDQVTVSVDGLSNILTLRVRAYDPHDSLRLSQKIIAASERLINEISRRSRVDAEKLAKAEMEVSLGELASARSQMLEFQQRSGALDPIESAKQITALISDLTSEQLKLESRLATAGNIGVTARPGDTFVRTRVDVLKGQIERLEALLTGNGKHSVSESLREFELLKLQEEFAEQMYKFSRTSFEDARRRLLSQQLYLLVVVPPALPEAALYPRVVLDTSVFLLGFLVAWGIGSLLVASILDSR
ncbi:hypothetical protein IB267_32055 [Ensifer sp. ENS09]|uniref:hypothetical protein n=1 Tax=Ensifer sp. ENS09 TaxID=2769263 RepID=UPI00177F40C5|nr:hypothetical protein [Ensifer sp. ENS09]MBD9653002.1 hypothetical protein [Ensifer sp. ENS09]